MVTQHQAITPLAIMPLATMHPKRRMLPTIIFTIMASHLSTALPNQPMMLPNLHTTLLHLPMERPLLLMVLLNHRTMLLSHLTMRLFLPMVPLCPHTPLLYLPMLLQLLAMEPQPLVMEHQLLVMQLLPTQIPMLLSIPLIMVS